MHGQGVRDAHDGRDVQGDRDHDDLPSPYVSFKFNYRVKINGRDLKWREIKDSKYLHLDFTRIPLTVKPLLQFQTSVLSDLNFFKIIIPFREVQARELFNRDHWVSSERY